MEPNQHGEDEETMTPETENVEAAAEPLESSEQESPVSESVEEVDVQAEAEPEKEESKMKWFALHVYSTFENKVKMNVEHLVTVEGYRENFGQILIPQENVVEVKGGKKEIVSKALMPGYMLVNMEPIDDLFNLISKVPGVSSFVGDGVHPIPLSEEEVTNIFSSQEEESSKPKAEIKYRIGEQVKVIDGPFVNFTGTVDEIDREKLRLKVMVNILGRSTAVELDVLQVEGL